MTGPRGPNEGKHAGKPTVAAGHVSRSHRLTALLKVLIRYLHDR